MTKGNIRHNPNRRMKGDETAVCCHHYPPPAPPSSTASGPLSPRQILQLLPLITHSPVLLVQKPSAVHHTLPTLPDKAGFMALKVKQAWGRFLLSPTLPALPSIWSQLLWRYWAPVLNQANHEIKPVWALWRRWLEEREYLFLQSLGSFSLSTVWHFNLICRKVLESRVVKCWLN